MLADHTCHLAISFPMTSVGLENQKPVCVGTGDNELWVMRGTFDAVAQDGVISGCNDYPDLRASGNTGFGPG